VLLAGTSTARLERIEVTGRRLGLKTASQASYCTGRYAFTGAYQVEPRPCPDQAPARAGRQCAACSARDEFRFAHQVHRGGHAPAALQAYLSQPHWLYLATFAGTIHKVGTAADPRRESRLAEQGPLCATYLTRAPDGRAVRSLEDALSQELGIPQAARTPAKLAALTRPDTRAAQDAHDDVAGRAARALTRWGLAPVLQPWQPPAQARELCSPQPGEQRVLYPHDLREGQHAFHVDACLGSAALARLTPGPAGIRYIIDLAALRGLRVDLGDYPPAQTLTQAALF
jgi:hypothetical protein